MTSYGDCQNNMQLQSCKDICNSSSRPAWCDGVMTQWCAQPQNQSTAQCACFDPGYEKIFPGLGITACFKPGCINSGEAYKTTSMLEISKNCPSVCGNFVQVGDQTKNLDVSGEMTAICTKNAPCNWTSQVQQQILYANVALIAILILFIVL